MVHHQFWNFPSPWTKTQGEFGTQTSSTCWQHEIINKNSEKVFNLENEKVSRFTSKCLCPCGTILGQWHKETHIVNLPTFKGCNTSIFQNHDDFVTHLYASQNDYFHRIVLRFAQRTYSILITKLNVNTPEDTFVVQTFLTASKTKNISDTFLLLPFSKYWNN